MHPGEAHNKFICSAANKMIDESVLLIIGSGLSRNWHMPGAEDLAKWLVHNYEGYRQNNGATVGQGGNKDSMPSADSPDKDSLLVYLSPDERKKLDLVAEALAVNKCWFLQKLFYRPWDPPPEGPHFFHTPEFMLKTDPVEEGFIGIPHIVIGRLAKEGLIREILTTNYDALLETGCLAVGMENWDEVTRREMFEDNQDGNGEGVSSVTATPVGTGSVWVDAFRVVSSRDQFASLVPRNRLFHIYKIHGCNQALAKLIGVSSEDYGNYLQGSPNNAGTGDTEQDVPLCGGCSPISADPECTKLQKDFTFVITRRELLHWRHDHWARDLFRDRVRSHHLILVGFGGADAVLHDSLQSVYDEVVEGQRVPSRAGSFRLQAVSTKLDLHLQQLMRAGAIADNRAGTVSGQFYELGEEKPRKAVEDLFRRLYVESMKLLFQRKLIAGGIAWVEGIVAGGGRSFETSVRQMVERLSNGLRTLPDEVWFSTLPKLVMISWLLNEPLDVTQGIGYLTRLQHPHYYVPLGPNEQLLYPLFAFCASLHAMGKEGVEGNKSSAPTMMWHEGGWVEVSLPTSERTKKSTKPYSVCRLLLLPVVAPSVRHTIRHPFLPQPDARPPARLARWPGTVSAVLYLQRGGGVECLGPGRSGVASVFPHPEVYHVRLPYEVLLEPQQFKKAMHKLQDCLIQAVRKGVRAS